MSSRENMDVNEGEQPRAMEIVVNEPPPDVPAATNDIKLVEPPTVIAVELPKKDDMPEEELESGVDVGLKPAKSLRMSPKILLDLPVDIQDMVTSYIIRPTDLVNLCLTCKSFHELAVRYLYKTVELDLGGDSDEHLAAFLNPANIGLKHVREVELYRADNADSCDSAQRQSSFAIRMLLEMLPKDQLHVFRWHPWDVFSTENMVMLFRKQKRLQWVGAIRLDKLFNDELLKRLNLDSALSNTTKLGLYPDSRDSLDFCNELLKRVKNPDKITIHTNFEFNEDRLGYITELNDTPTEPGILTGTLFRHMLPFHTCTPITPRNLCLEVVNLRYCTNTYTKVIDFSNIQKLSICLCPGADALLAALCHSSRLPQNFTKFEFKHDDVEEEAATNALDTFLCLASGIKTLTIDIGGSKRLPSALAITRHSKTLLSLNCHTWRQKSQERGPHEEMVFDREAFEKITKACRHIEQLSVAFPTTYIGRTNTEEFDAFSSCLGNLPNLVTCNVTTWPQNKSSTSFLPRKMYEQLIWAEAQEGFDTSITNAASKRLEQAVDPNSSEPCFTTSKLNVIAWGISDKIFERDDSKNMLVFVKGKQLDPLGGPPKTTAVRMSMTLKHYYEPRSDILDVPLSRSVKPPTRENEDVEDW